MLYRIKKSVLSLSDIIIRVATQTTFQKKEKKYILML